MGLTVAPELTPSEICAKYRDDGADYDRDKPLDRVRRTTDRDLYSPYTGRTFWQECDVHIVARKEANYWGLCRKENAHRRSSRRTSSDSPSPEGGSSRPSVNAMPRHGPPPLNRCWFATQVVRVRKKYSRTIDESERAALVAILSDRRPEQLSLDRNPDPTVPRLMKWDATGPDRSHATNVERRASRPRSGRTTKHTLSFPTRTAMAGWASERCSPRTLIQTENPLTRD